MEDDKKEVKVEQVEINNATANANTSDVADAAGTTNTADARDVKITDLQDKISDLTDKYMRAVAELENTRRRSARDMESAARGAGMSIAKKFLPVMDALDAALKQAPDDAGIKSLAMAIESAFAQIGIVKIESVGQPLNPQFHSAISTVPADATHTSNTICQEMQTGYMYGDVVLRPAMVVVYK